MTALSQQGQRLHQARDALAAASTAAKSAAVQDVRQGISEVEAARRHGITRATLRKALGKG